ncbi:hypothetical protein [uncultured Roseibium sp.]|uniref:hypothetical protein n=1 Tax=uncultured Roseibium sp. TaxID=1936171 RepID=UPI002634A78E|nr:hypothetical protein [uncultured Roseibium sp.]
MTETARQSSKVTQTTHATTTGMVGGGFYDENSAPQWRAIEAVFPLIGNAMATLEVENEGTIRLADFGCSEGHNSIAVMTEALNTLLPRTSRSVQTIHSDLPTNDFSKLFLNLRPVGRSVYGSERVFSCVVAGSMYDQLVPNRSLHLAMTFNAIGFLSRRPLRQLPDYIFPNGPSAARSNGKVSETDRQTFADLAKQDVADFLKVRARELAPGGKLIVQVFGRDSDASTSDGIYDLLNDAILAFVESGEISREAYASYYQPVYMRSLEELTVPATDPSYAVSDLFKLDQSMSYEVPVPFNEAFQQDSDLTQYAACYVNFFRAFTEAVLKNALPDNAERDQLVDRVYAKALELLKANPEAYPFRYMAVAMLLTRKV